MGRWLWFRFPLRVLLRPSFGGQAGEDSFGVLCCFKGSTTRGVWYGPIIPHFTVVFYDFINIFGFFAYCRGWGVGFRAIKFLVYALCLLRLYLAALEKLGLEQLNLRFLPCQLKSSRRPKAIHKKFKCSTANTQNLSRKPTRHLQQVLRPASSLPLLKG